MAFNYNGTDLPYIQNSREGNAASWLSDYFKQQFGRNPTQDEISQFLPAYMGTDKNITDTAQGNAAVSRYHQQQDPSAPFAAEAPKQYDTVNSLFKQYLDRDATDEEKSHFGTLLASKQYDAYTIGQVLQTLPENVQKQDKAFREGLNTDLQKQDSQYFNEQILPGISQSFAKSGRSFDSSGYAQALAQSAQGQNRTRESFLSNLTAEQYQGSQANARQDYLNNYSYTRDRSNQVADSNQARLYGVEDYNIQKQAYDAYLQRYGKRGGGGNALSGGISGGMSGAATGATVGGPWGALIGGVAGAGLGVYGSSR